jgi:two-component system, chemotaxis family, response regulator Rcp1
MSRKLHVLLVEDNPADAALMTRILRETANPKLSIVSDGVEAERFLRRQDPYGGAEMPDLILLDLNLPRKSGMEVLAEIKADPRLKIVPVIVLTGSGSQDDIVRSYALGANSYLKKAVTLEAATEMFQTVQQFWMNLALLPTEPDRPY